ncbi:hypothetical protein [Streptomyces puniciscabiei]|uniref:hypothetical protein n=1 Tax=Streptomyces puniciscabiei TaxID=164348 RepID=UPI003328E5D5
MSTVPPEDPGLAPDAAPTPAAPRPSHPYRDLPPAEQARAWNRTVPGAAEHMLRLVEQDFEQQQRVYDHQRRMDIANLWLRAVGIAVGPVASSGT